MLAWLIVLSLFLSACDDQKTSVQSTRIFLRVQASAAVQDAGKMLTVAVARERANDRWDVVSSTELDFERIARWPVDIPVKPESGEDGERALEFVVRAVDGAGDILAEARAITSYALREQVVLETSLAACLDAPLQASCEQYLPCHGDRCRTCLDGACVATPIFPAAELMRFDEHAAIHDESHAEPVLTDGEPVALEGGIEPSDDDVFDSGDESGGSEADGGTEDADTSPSGQAGAEAGLDAEAGAEPDAMVDGGAGVQLKVLAAQCRAAEECQSGQCVEGICCDRACENPCDSCHRVSSPGICGAVDYVTSNLTDNCGGCGIFCSARNVVPQCTAGVCDGACTSGFADCNRDKQRDGCETEVRTVQNCGRCGNTCVYGYCDGTGCEWTFSGSNEATGSWPIAAGELRGAWFVFSGTDRWIRALGALVDPALPGATLRLALYREDSQGLPTELVVQTDQLPTLDNPQSLVMGKNMVRVEGNVRRTQLDPQVFYWLFVTVTQPTRISAYAAGGVTEWRSAVGDAVQGYPERFPPSSAQDAPVLDLYAITTAQ